MAPIKLQAFQGKVPRTAPHLLGELQAQIARECDLVSGEIRPIKDMSTVQAVAAGTRTIFPWNGSWQTWASEVNVAKSPLVDDFYTRIYFTGDGAPKVRGLDGAVKTFALGIPKPPTAPTVAAQAKGSIDWSRDWGWFYEEPDGTQNDIDRTISIREAAFGWTLSGGGVDEWYLRLAAGTDPNILSQPLSVFENVTTAMAEGVLGALVAGEWGYGDNDALGYSTIYVRLTVGGDPDLQAAGFVRSLLVPNEVVKGKQYVLPYLPDKSAASASAVFVLWFTAVDSNGSLLGRLYPQHSAYKENSDFFLQGASGTAAQTNSTTAIFDITYDTSRASEYTLDRSYVQTYVSAWGEEGPPSDESVLVAVDPTQDCNLTALPTTVFQYLDNAAAVNEGSGKVGLPVSGNQFRAGQTVTIAGTVNFNGSFVLQDGTTGAKLIIIDAYVAEVIPAVATATLAAASHNITAKRIYRTVTSLSGTDFQLVAEIALATATYLDTLTDGDCTTVLPSEGWVVPRYNLEGLIVCPWGGLAGFVDRTVCFTPAGHLHAWPAEYELPVEHDIVALAVIGGSIAILTDTKPYVTSGAEPGALVASEIPFPQGCVSARGVAAFGGIILYPSPDGLALLDPASPRMITEGLYDLPEWRALVPSAMIGAIHDNRYFGTTASGMIILRFGSQNIHTETAETATAFYADPETDTLYLVQGTSLKSWGTAAGNKTATWRGKEYRFPAPWAPACARVVADSYSSVTLRLYANGVLVSSSTVAGGTAFRLPILRKEKAWWLEVVSDSPIHELTVGNALSEL